MPKPSPCPSPLGSLRGRGFGRNPSHLTGHHLFPWDHRPKAMGSCYPRPITAMRRAFLTQGPNGLVRNVTPFSARPSLGLCFQPEALLVSQRISCLFTKSEEAQGVLPSLGTSLVSTALSWVPRCAISVTTRPNYQHTVLADPETNLHNLCAAQGLWLSAKWFACK